MKASELRSIIIGLFQENQELSTQEIINLLEDYKLRNQFKHDFIRNTLQSLVNKSILKRKKVASRSIYQTK